MPQDWTATKTDEHGAIQRIYSTHYYDRVSGIKLEVVSVPAFVLRMPDPTPEPAPIPRWSVEHVVDVSSELLGENAQLFQIASRTGRFRPVSKRLATDTAASFEPPDFEEIGIQVESVSEGVALDMMLGRAEHRAFRTQLEFATVPVESSAPDMQSVVDLVRGAIFLIVNPGIGGIAVTAAGTAIAIIAKKGTESLADQAALAVTRSFRSLTKIGRLENQSESLEKEKNALRVTNEILELKAKNLELKTKLNEAEGSRSEPTRSKPNA